MLRRLSLQKRRRSVIMQRRPSLGGAEGAPYAVSWNGWEVYIMKFNVCGDDFAVFDDSIGAGVFLFPDCFCVLSGYYHCKAKR